MIVSDPDSPYQQIRLQYDPGEGLSLFLDDERQFTQSSEHRYHESLAVVPLLFTKPRRVFIGGGGDGLAATRVLRFSEVNEIVICDHAPVVTRLAAEEPALVELNEGALRDPRVRVVNDDAEAWLRDSPERFDLIICDFPDPYSEVVGRVYSTEFYRLAKRRLTQRGLLITQTCMVPGSTAIIRSTVRRVFPFEYFFRTNAAEGPGASGFTIGSLQPLVEPRPVPDWTRYLNDALVGALFVRPKDESYETDTVNTHANQALVRNTMLCRLQHRVGHAYIHNPDYFVVPLAGETPIGEARMLQLLEYMADAQPLIVYLEEAAKARYAERLASLGYEPRSRFTGVRFPACQETRASLERWHRRLGDGSRTILEWYTGAARDYPELLRLLEASLERHPGALYDIDDPDDIRDIEGVYIIGRNPDREAKSYLLLSLGRDTQVLAGHDTGGPRGRLLSILLALRELLEVSDNDVTFYFAEERDASSLARLGGVMEEPVEVWGAER